MKLKLYSKGSSCHFSTRDDPNGYFNTVLVTVNWRYTDT